MIDNPYWDTVKDWTTPSGNDYTGPQIADMFGPGRPRRGGVDVNEWASRWERRRELVSMYSWSVPDPPTVDFVVEHSKGRIVDPIAGTGYWTYLLAQSGVDCVAYDKDPPQPSNESNLWHKYSSTFGFVRQGDAVDAVTVVSPSKTLFLSWPPYDELVAYEVLHAYRGERLIYIGEGNGGCTADETFFAELEAGWTEVASHTIAQWSGIHDFVMVFDRNRTRAGA
jgi:hypothetical protein